VNQKVAFLTTIFPMKQEYLTDFFTSLQRQTFKKFDLIVVNDGYEGLSELLLTYKDLNVIELKYNETPAKNREYGINYIKNNNYDILIFGDSDDYFKDNRIQVSIEELTKYDIVVNDLSLFNSESIYSERYISNRIKNMTEIDLEFIKEKNIFGLSNTALNINILDNMYFDKKLIAVDWYLFSILLAKGHKAIFTNNTETFYRQHASNTVGIGNLTKEIIVKGMLAKFKHYELLQKEMIQYRALFLEISQLKVKVEKEEFIEKLKKQNIMNPLWWEEIKLI